MLLRKEGTNAQFCSQETRVGASEPSIAYAPAESIAAPRNVQRSFSSEFFGKAVTAAEVMADFVASAIGVCTAYYFYFSLQIGKHVHYPMKEVTAVAAVVGMLIVLLLERDGAYTGGNSLLKIRETERAIRIPWQALIIVLPVTFILGQSFSRGALLLALVFVPLLLIIQKHFFSTAIRLLHAKGYGVRRVVIYGAGYTGRRVLTALLNSPKLGLNPIGIFDDNVALKGSSVFELGYRRSRSIIVQGGSITAEMLTACQCDMLIVAIPSLSREKFFEASQAAIAANAELTFLADRAIGSHHWMESIDVDGLLLTSIGDPKAAWRYDILKRLFDIVGGALILFLMTPTILIISLLIRLDSPGPILFVQERVGKKGRPFKMYKFRSMRTDAPKYGVSPSDSKDPRITRVGKFLRKTSIDELPQIFNVIRGDMSLVGPRPEMPFIVEKYDLRQRQRLQVVPGITGLWQLSADRAFHIHENIQYDLYYIRNRSFFMDLAVLIHTAFFAMRGV